MTTGTTAGPVRSLRTPRRHSRPGDAVRAGLHGRLTAFLASAKERGLHGLAVDLERGVV